MIDVVVFLGAIIDALAHGIDVVTQLVGADRAKAVFLGLALSGFSAQFFKSLPFVIAARRRPLITRTWAVAVAFAAIYALYPHAQPERVIASFAACFFSPPLYQITVRVLDRYWRGARVNLSGDPNTMPVDTP